MTKPGWNEIRDGLRNSRPDAIMPASGEFWPDFKARARLRYQERLVPYRALPAGPVWALASACAVALAVWIGFQAVYDGQDMKQNSIKSFQVLAAHSAVMIMEDESTSSTVLWIVDMDSDGDTGGDAS